MAAGDLSRLDGIAEADVELDLDGDAVPFVPGSARSALRYPVFRRVFVGAFLSNIGNWMQMVVLGALAYRLSNSSSFVGLMVFAQLGPLLLLSSVGGLMADRIDRRKLLIAVTTSQLVLALVLAVVVLPDQPNRALLVGVVFAIGLGQAIYGPTYAALLPQLVDRRDLVAAVSLNSTQMNLSRVIGPVIGAVLNSVIGASAVFVGNAASFLFVIGALLTVQLPAPERGRHDSKGLQALGDGFRIARRNSVVWCCLATMFWFSLISLPFVGQFPVLAERNLDVDSRSIPYGVLYACFGVGAALGSLSVGTVFRERSKARLTQLGLVAFAGSLAVFALLRAPVPAYPIAALVGFAYFTVVTSLATALQERLADRERGRVMALWIMAFGGTVPIGNLAAGPLIDATSITVVVLVGAVFAAALSWYARVGLAPAPREDRTPELAHVGCSGAVGR